MKKFDFIPEGYHGVTPALTVRNAVSAIDWYKRVFGAQEIMRLMEPDGKIAHAELRIMDSVIMLGEENPAYNTKSPQALNGTPVALHIYVQSADDVAERAVDAGAKIIFPVNDQFYGDRAGRIQDPFGYMWIISTRKENLSPQEMQRRMDELYKEDNVTS